MTMVFFNSSENMYYIFSETGSKKVNKDTLLKTVPEEDIFYVKDAYIFGKEQFIDFVSGNKKFQTQEADDFDSGFRFNNQPQTEQADPNKLYIHTTRAGTVRIEDITSKDFPDGIQLNGKYHFIPVNLIGEHNLEESRQFKHLMAKGKIEIVSEEYVKKNRHKGNSTSRRERELNSIIVPDDRHGAARRFASDGGFTEGTEQDGFFYPTDGGPIEFEVHP